MPWICPICSTSNEESATKCFVCDYKRKVNKTNTLTFNRVQKLRFKGDVIVPSKFNAIGEGAFKGRKDIYSVKFKGKIEKIGKEAFSGCKNLRRVESEYEVGSIASKAFADCNSLSPVFRPNAKHVANDAYYMTPITPKPKAVKSSETAGVTPSGAIKKKTVEMLADSHVDISRERLVSKERIIAQVVVLFICALFLFPFVELYVNSFWQGNHRVCYCIIGSGLVLSLLYTFFLLAGNVDEKTFIKKKPLIQSLFISIIFFVLTVIYGTQLKQWSIFINSLLLLGDIIIFGQALSKRKPHLWIFMSWLILLNGFYITILCFL